MAKAPLKVFRVGLDYSSESLVRDSVRAIAEQSEELLTEVLEYSIGASLMFQLHVLRAIAHFRPLHEVRDNTTSQIKQMS